MKQVINGLTYNTETAEHICELPCKHYGSDFAAHDTDLYRTKKGAYFLAGKGGPMSMWATPAHGGGTTGSSGIIPIDKADAMHHAEDAQLSPEEMIAAGFDIQDA